MLDRIRQLILNKGFRDAEITPDTDLIFDLGINSLDLVELVCAFEQEFCIVVPDRDIKTFRKISDIVSYLEARVSG